MVYRYFMVVFHVNAVILEVLSLIIKIVAPMTRWNMSILDHTMK